MVRAHESDGPQSGGRLSTSLWAAGSAAATSDRVGPPGPLFGRLSTTDLNLVKVNVFTRVIPVDRPAIDAAMTG